MPAINLDPVPFQAVALVAFSLRVLESPFKVPAERDTVPVKVCVNPTPKSSVPPFPNSVNPAAFTLLVNVAVPAVFVITTAPVVVKPAMLCATMVPEITI